MPRGMYKSRTFRRIKKRLPGGTTELRYGKRKPKKAKCAECSKPLNGTPRERPYKMETMAKTKKRPQRPYGGVLCSSCMRKTIKDSIRTAKKNV